MIVLELFAGTRSIGKSFEEKGHKVFSVEWDKNFKDITLYEDINNITAKDIIKLCGGVPDIIWASPDCTTFGTIPRKTAKNINKFINKWLSKKSKEE